VNNFLTLHHSPERSLAMKLAVLLLTLLAISTHAQERPAAVLSASGGRFVFGQASQHRADQFLLDTQTGRMWRLVSAGAGGGADYLEPVYVLTLAGTKMPFPLTFEQELSEASRIDRANARTNPAAIDAAAVTQKYFGTNAPALKLEPVEPKKP